MAAVSMCYTVRSGPTSGIEAMALLPLADQVDQAVAHRTGISAQAQRDDVEHACHGVRLRRCATDSQAASLAVVAAVSLSASDTALGEGRLLAAGCVQQRPLSRCVVWALVLGRREPFGDAACG